MIRLQKDKMAKAVERAKADRMHVRCTGERVYAVRSNSGNVYTVRFAVANGMKLAECNCKAGQAGMMCKHIAASVAVHIAIATMKKRVADQAAPLTTVKPGDKVWAFNTNTKAHMLAYVVELAPARYAANGIYVRWILTEDEIFDQTVSKSAWVYDYSKVATAAASTSPTNATLHIEGYAGHRAIPVQLTGRETPKKIEIRAIQGMQIPGNHYLDPGETALVPKSAVTQETERAQIEREITSKWQARWPNYRIADTLMKEYGRNSLALMPTGYLQDILRVWFGQAAY